MINQKKIKNCINELNDKMVKINLQQGNCFELMHQIPDGGVNLVVTDPPFEYVQGGMKSKRLNRGTWQKQSYTNTAMSSFKHDDIFNFLDLVIPKMKKVNMFIFCSKLQLAHYFDYLNQHKKLKFDLLIWDKSSESNKYSMKSSMFFSNDIEYVIRIYQNGVHLNKIWNKEHTHADSRLYMKRQKFQQPRGIHEIISIFYKRLPLYNPQFTEGKPYKFKRGNIGSNYKSSKPNITISNGKRYPRDVLKIKWVTSNSHPTEKPVSLLEYLIKTYTNENMTVLDNCMGSGSTGVACVNTNRNFIGMELDDKYFEIAQQRIEETNRKEKSYGK